MAKFWKAQILKAGQKLNAFTITTDESVVADLSLPLNLSLIHLAGMGWLLRGKQNLDQNHQDLAKGVFIRLGFDADGTIEEIPEAEPKRETSTGMGGSGTDSITVAWTEPAE